MSFTGIHLNRRAVFVLFCLTCIWFMYRLSSKSNATIVSEKTINLGKLLRVAIKASENGGLEVVNQKDNLVVKSKGLTKEGAQDPVTTADYLSHCSILKTLKYHFPDLLVISEEAKTKCDDGQVIDYKLSASLDSLPEEHVDINDITVWIDPLDATQEYTEGLFEYVTTMVCVAVRGKPVIGVIHEPFALQTSWSWTGYTRSPKLIHEETPPDRLKIVISRSHSGEVKNILKKHIEKFQLIEAGGSGYKALLVATGRVDAYVHVTAIKKWDICAGNAILKAMGGSMTTKFNDQIDYSNLTSFRNEKGLVATFSPRIHDMFIGKL